MKLKVLGHGHVFEVWILISSAVADNPDLNTWFWSDLIGQQLGAPADCIQGAIYSRPWRIMP